jgi:hypothetical protein
VTPCRVLDTRNAPGSLGGPALFPGWQRVFTVAGTCGVPTTAKAVSVNLTVVASASGSLSLFPGDAASPGTWSITFNAGRARANNAILTLSGDGTGTIAVSNASEGTNHLILDVNGYFQ